MLAQPGEVPPHVAIGVESRSLDGRAPRPNVVHARDQAAQAAQQRLVELVGGAAATPVRDRVPDAVHLAQRGAVGERTNGADRHLLRREVGEEGVLLEDLLGAPSSGAVELDDDATAIDQLHFVDAVLEGVERIAHRVGAQPGRLDRREHALGSEPEEEVRRRRRSRQFRRWASKKSNTPFIT